MSTATQTLEIRVRDFFAQRRIAVAGVSRKRGRHQADKLIYERFKKNGHEVFAVNPNMQSYDGVRCYPNVGAIPGGVDAVVIVTRPEASEQIVRDCGEAGVRYVWMHQGVSGGSSVSAKAAEYCRQHSINVIAGACPMMFGPGADFGHTCMRWYLRWTGGLPA